MLTPITILAYQALSPKGTNPIAHSRKPRKDNNYGDSPMHPGVRSANHRYERWMGNGRPKPQASVPPGMLAISQEDFKRAHNFFDQYRKKNLEHHELFWVFDEYSERRDFDGKYIERTVNGKVEVFSFIRESVWNSIEILMTPPVRRPWWKFWQARIALERKP